MKLDQLSEPVSLRRQLIELRTRIAVAAQNIYDEWQQDEKTLDDEELGAGGICDQIAEAIGGIIATEIEDVELDVELDEYGHEGDDHAAVTVSRDGESYVVDVPHNLYESGSGYVWHKIQNVRFNPEDVEIYPL